MNSIQFLAEKLAEQGLPVMITKEGTLSVRADNSVYLDVDTNGSQGELQGWLSVADPTHGVEYEEELFSTSNPIMALAELRKQVRLIQTAVA